MPPRKIDPLRRLTAGLMAFLIGFGPMTPMAQAAATKLADGPIGVSIEAKPNIVYTLDDSTSMNLNFLPDYLVINTLTNAATSYCRGATGLAGCGNVGTAALPQYVYAEWLPAGVLGPTSTHPLPAGYGGSSYGPPAVMSAAFNSVFYNPLVTYTAPKKYDGSSYPDMNASNTSSWTSVPADPFLFPAKVVNLQTKVNVGVWCNTTYAGAKSVLNGITIGGNHCRINGWPYLDGTVAAPAPAVPGDYNYPYSRNTGSTALSNFFDKNTRTIHCNPNRINGTISGGTSEVAPTAPTCGACPLSCPVAQVEDPTSPAGCDLGCTNPAECTKCNLKCPVATDYLCTTSCTTPALSCAASGNSWAAQPKSCTPGPNEKCTTHPGACATTGGTWTAASAACTTVLNDTAKNKATDPMPASVKGKTYDEDANGEGWACRRNNFTYPDGTVAGGWKYPSGTYTTAVTSSCGTITAAINRHYYRASVQWCNTQLPTAGSNDKWRGFGTGTCKPDKSAVYQYPKFVKYNVDLTAAQDNYTDAAFELVELDYVNKKIIIRNGTPVTTITHADDYDGPPISVTRGDVNADTPDVNELVNYANWFAYYRTRILAAKTVTSLAFSDLTDKFRVGFHTLSNVPATDFLTVADFVGGATNHRDKWYGKLAGVKIPMGNDTPLLSGVSRIGDWFMSSTGTLASLSGSTDPITLSCQKNYHVLFTDGYTNQAAKPSTLVGNIDGVVIPAKTTTTMPESITDLVPGTAWPNIIKEGATAVADSLSDYTLYYWMKDLRPPTFPVAVAENNVPTSGNDPAKWQHLNFAGLSLGTEGVLPSRDPSTVESQIKAGTIKWTTPAPFVYRPGVTGVDDLWHASLAARSQFVNARDPAALREGMENILDDISITGGTRASATFSSVNFTATDNYVYRVRTEPGWGGSLRKVSVKADGEGEIAIITSYHDVLATQITPAFAGDEPWYDKRRIVTKTSVASAAVPFRLANLTTGGVHTTLGATATVQKKVVDYLRGDRSNEGTKPGSFRLRTGVLGDIVNSSPVVVGPPNAPYSDSTDPNYEAFKTAKAGRKKMLYVGANDGMLHAFDEASGEELWAYVPSFMYNSAPDKGLAMLAKRGKFFKHQMFVDSTPVVADVDIGGTWKTVLVGGLGKGGKGYYAIDITDPGTITSETDAAGKVMWEFTDTTAGNELGYSYGKPLIAKTYAHGWVAVVSSGHNAGGKGRIYVLKLSDGSVLGGGPFETSAGSTADPSGLAQIAGFVLSYKNQYLEQIYGGDLLGNVWRFDVSNASTASWAVEKLATLNIGGSPQSVTMAPQIEVDIGNGVDRYVMVGTGRLLHADDLADYATQKQTMYVIRDGTVLAMNTTGLPLDPRSDTGFSPLVDLTNGFTGLTVKGWYHDLPLGERIVSPIAAELGFVGYAGSLPPANECIPGLSANVYVREFANAKSVIDDGAGGLLESFASSDGTVGMDFVNIYQADPTYPTLKLAITIGSDGTTKYIDLEPPPGFGDHRMSWRLLGR